MQNIKITLSVNGQAVLSNRPTDGMLAKLYFEKLKAEGKFSGDYAQRLPFLEFNKGGFYHASNLFYEKYFLENQTIFKSFDPEDYANHSSKTKINKKIFESQRGTFKFSLGKFEKSFVRDLVFYIRGDFEAIKELLKDLKAIGKKNAYGWGKISKIVIEEIEEDMSVVYGKKLMRHIPFDSDILKKVDKKNYAVALLSLTHPYWDRGREQYCAMPVQ